MADFMVQGWKPTSDSLFLFVLLMMLFLPLQKQAFHIFESLLVKGQEHVIVLMKINFNVHGRKWHRMLLFTLYVQSFEGTSA